MIDVGVRIVVVMLIEGERDQARKCAEPPAGSRLCAPLKYQRMFMDPEETIGMLPLAPGWRFPFFFMRTNGKVCRGKAGRIGAGCQCWERVERAGDAEKGQCEEPGPHAAALRLSSSSGVDFERSCLVLFASRASQSLRVLCPFCGEACPTGADLFSTLGQAFLFVL